MLLLYSSACLRISRKITRRDYQLNWLVLFSGMMLPGLRWEATLVVLYMFSKYFFTPHEWPRQNFSLHHQNNIIQTSDENKEKYQLGDYYLIWYKILWTNIIRIVRYGRKMVKIFVKSMLKYLVTLRYRVKQKNCYPAEENSQKCFMPLSGCHVFLWFHCFSYFDLVIKVNSKTLQGNQQVFLSIKAQLFIVWIMLSSE